MEGIVYMDKKELENFPKNAVERALELLKVKESKLPIVALRYRNYLSNQVGLCIETCITAFACYAQYVEGFTTDDELYKIPDDVIVWFFYNTVRQVERKV